MSGGRVTIPNNVRKTIQNIKEITGNHSEDEIYAMLKECSMDPNETAQKLLLQGTLPPFLISWWDLFFFVRFVRFYVLVDFRDLPFQLRVLCAWFGIFFLFLILSFNP